MHDANISHKQLDSKAVYCTGFISQPGAFIKIGKLGEASTLEEEETEKNLGYLDKYDEEGEGCFEIGAGAFGKT